MLRPLSTGLVVMLFSGCQWSTDPAAERPTAPSENTQSIRKRCPAGTVLSNGSCVPANQAPYAEANGPYSGSVGSAIPFTSNGSADPEGVFSSTWDFGDGARVTAQNPTHAYATSGYYTARLTVTDTAGATATDTASVTITNPVSFRNQTLSPQTGVFTLTVDAVPARDRMTGAVGLSKGPASWYSDLAVTVAFQSTGVIQAINGGTYTAASVIPYSAGTTYRLRLVVDVQSHRYDAYVRPAGGSELLIGTGFAFRTEQAQTSTLDTLADYSYIGELTLSNVSLASVATPPAFQSPAELPRAYLDTHYVQPTGRTINVSAGGDLQAAINAALPGDQIVLPAGETFNGNFSLPAKNGTSWITIRSSGSLPPEGTRVTPANAAQLAKIVASGSQPAFRTQAGASFYRLMGLEITGPTSGSYILVSLGSPSQTASQVPHDLVIDRSYIHGLAGIATYMCIELDTARTALVDSWVSECHSNASTDGGYAIKGVNGPGPFKIVNNRLSASGVAVLFGGSDPSITGLVPSDMEIRRNHFFRPDSWKGVWLVKNIFEFKNGQRALIEGNVFEGNWADGQAGHAIVFFSSNQNGACTWCVAGDINFRYNKVFNSGFGATVSADPGTGAGPAVPARRLTFYQNVFDRLQTGIYTASSGLEGVGIQSGGAIADLVLEHNTFMVTTTSVGFFRFAYGNLVRFIYRNNLVTRGTTGIRGSGTTPAEGTATLQSLAPGFVFAGNAIIGGSTSLYPPGNFFPTSVAAAGVANAAAFDWTLTASSPYKGVATDGRDPGADFAAVTSATAGVAMY
jgi:PKD repeat protein